MVSKKGRGSRMMSKRKGGTNNIARRKLGVVGAGKQTKGARMQKGIQNENWLY